MIIPCRGFLSGNALFALFLAHFKDVKNNYFLPLCFRKLLVFKDIAGEWFSIKKNSIIQIK